MTRPSELVERLRNHTRAPLIVYNLYKEQAVANENLGRQEAYSAICPHVQTSIKKPPVVVIAQWASLANPRNVNTPLTLSWMRVRCRIANLLILSCALSSAYPHVYQRITDSTPPTPCARGTTRPGTLLLSLFEMAQESPPLEANNVSGTGTGGQALNIWSSLIEEYLATSEA